MGSVSRNAGGVAARPHPRLLGAVVGCVVLAVGGCSSGSTDDFRRSDFTPNRAQYTLPLDSYQVLPAQETYATVLLVKQCAEKQGITSYRLDDAPTPYLLMNPHFRRLFDVSIAKRWGYSGPDTTDVVRSQDSLRAMTPQDAKRTLECVKVANTTLQKDMRQQNRIEGLIGIAAEKARQRPKIRAELAAWKECLRPLGFADLPADPVQMPTDAQRLAWHFPVHKEDTVYYKLRRASIAEIKGATMDAECRESTGLAQDLYDAEVDEQFAQMNSHPEIVAEAKAYTDKVNDKVRAVIQEISG